MQKTSVSNPTVYTNNLRSCMRNTQLIIADFKTSALAIKKLMAIIIGIVSVLKYPDY